MTKMIIMTIIWILIFLIIAIALPTAIILIIKKISNINETKRKL